MTDDDIHALSVAIHGGITPEEHISQHAFITTWIERENRKVERWEKIKAQVIGWSIVTILGGIGTGVYRASMWARDHLKY